MLSIVIPTLNAARHLPATLESLKAGVDCEVIVVDGGSTDETAVVAKRAGARVIVAEPGRGNQLVAGAKAAAGEWLLFLHADTCLAPGWVEAARAFTADPANRDRVAVFRFALDDKSVWARLMERLVQARCKRLGLPYGDQGLLISKAAYRTVGGYRPLVLMEDVDFVRRLGRRRIVILDCPAVTSAARYRREGYLVRGLRNLFCLGLFVAGVAPQTIARIYR